MTALPNATSLVMTVSAKSAIRNHLISCQVFYPGPFTGIVRDALLKSVEAELTETTAGEIWQRMQQEISFQEACVFPTLADFCTYFRPYFSDVLPTVVGVEKKTANGQVQHRHIPQTPSYLENETFCQLAAHLRLYQHAHGDQTEASEVYHEPTEEETSEAFYRSSALVLSQLPITDIRETMDRFSVHLPKGRFWIEFPNSHQLFLMIRVELSTQGLSLQIAKTRLVNDGQQVRFTRTDSELLLGMNLNYQGLVFILGRGGKKRIVPATPANFAKLTFTNSIWHESTQRWPALNGLLARLFHTLYLTQLATHADFLRQESYLESIARVSLRASFADLTRFTNRRDLFQELAGGILSRRVGRWSSIEIGAMLAIQPLINPRDYNLMQEQLRQRGAAWLAALKPYPIKRFERHVWGKTIITCYLREVTSEYWPLPEPIALLPGTPVADSQLLDDYLSMCWDSRSYPNLRITGAKMLLKIHDEISKRERLRILLRSHRRSLSVYESFKLPLDENYELITTVDRLLLESDQMQNCVHNRIDSINQGNLAIYSYREPGTKRRFTVELIRATTGLSVSEIRGFANASANLSLYQQVEQDLRRATVHKPARDTTQKAGRNLTKKA